MHNKKTYNGSYIRRNSVEDFIRYFSNKTWDVFKEENPEYKNCYRKPIAFNVKGNIERYYNDPSYKDYIDQKRKERRSKDKEIANHARKHNDPVKKLKNIRKAQKIGCRNKSNGSALSQIKSGQIQKWIQGGQRATREYWDNITLEKKTDHINKLWEGQKPIIEASQNRLESIYNSLPINFTTMDMYNALESHGLSRGSKSMLHKKYREQPGGYTKIKRGHFKKIN